MERLEEGGRVAPGGASRYERELMARHVFAYRLAAESLRPGDRVLEIGAGEGYGSSILAGRAASVLALDPDPAAVAHARAAYPSANLSFAAAPAEKLPCGGGEFDCVVSFQVIEHLEDPRLFLAEAARVLKPGGRLVLTTPNRVHRIKEGGKPWYRFHVREFSAAELDSLLGGFFLSRSVRFVSAPEEHFALELKVARAAALAQRLDPLGLRNLVPYGLKSLVFSLLSLRGGEKAAGPAAGPEFTLADSDIRGVDLWAEAVKPLPVVPGPGADVPASGTPKRGRPGLLMIQALLMSAILAGLGVMVIKWVLARYIISKRAYNSSAAVSAAEGCAMTAFSSVGLTGSASDLPSDCPANPAVKFSAGAPVPVAGGSSSRVRVKLEED